MGEGGEVEQEGWEVNPNPASRPECKTQLSIPVPLPGKSARAEQALAPHCGWSTGHAGGGWA